MITNEKTKWNSLSTKPDKKARSRMAFDWLLFGFIAIVIILLVTLLSIT